MIDNRTSNLKTDISIGISAAEYSEYGLSLKSHHHFTSLL